MVTAVNTFALADCLKAAAAVEADLTQLAATLTEAQFHAPPRDGGWSVGYCIEHLVLAGQAFLPKWDTALKDAPKAEGPDERFQYAWWQRKALSYAENPSKLRTKTRHPFEPYTRRSTQETVSRFLGMH